MINVVDRVPTEVLSNGAVRWEQFDSSGNSLGYVYLKRADEPAVVGTPINKALFDSIKANIYLSGLFSQIDAISTSGGNNIFHLDYLLDNYQMGMIVNIDTTPKNTQEETFNTRIFPVFSENEYSKNGFEITPTSSASWRAFDNNTSTKVGGTSGTGSLSVKIDCPYYIKPSKIHIQTVGTSSSTNFIVYGIDKNDNKTELINRPATSTINEDIVVNSSKYFKSFGFDVNNSIGCAEFSIISGTKTTYSDTTRNYLDINNLGTKEIIGENIDVSKKYTLIYDGTAFNAKEVYNGNN